MNVQNDFRSREFRKKGREDFEIRNGVDVNKIVALLQLFPSQKNKRAQEKEKKFPEICEFPLLINDPALDSVNTNAVNNFL